MKKILLILCFVAGTAVGARGQLSHLELTLGAGLGTTSDELIGASLIMALNLGPALHFSFNNVQAAYADNVYLEIYPNLARRGGRWNEEWYSLGSIRTGYYHAWFLQCPVTLGYKFELPIHQAGHYVGFFFGPAPCLGIGGHYRDQMETPKLPENKDVNYTYEDNHVFKHIRRWDVSLLLGATYRRGDLTLNIYYDNGFVPLFSKDDALGTIRHPRNTNNDNNNNNNNNNQTRESDGSAGVDPDAKIVNAYTGTHRALILSVAYHMPLKKRK